MGALLVGALGHLVGIVQEAIRVARQQAPDLLVYKPDFSDWFFCEVKGPHDHMRPVQSAFFEALSSLSSRPVYYVRVLESSSAPA